MRALLLLENPWCLSGLLVLIVLLVLGAALVSRSRRYETRAASGRAIYPAHEIAATAPFEALQAMGERLAEIQRHLSPDSQDAQWLAQYRRDVQQTMDQVYYALQGISGQERLFLLDRLGVEVAALEQGINQHLSATLNDSTNRGALATQLEQLRRSLSLDGNA